MRAPRTTLRLRKPNPAIADSARRLRADSTKSEELSWAALRNGQVEGRKFRRQHPVDRFVLDFYCRLEHLAIETDGKVHKKTRDADAERQALLESMGIRFLRLPAELVEEDLDRALQLVREALAAPLLPSPAAQERGDPLAVRANDRALKGRSR